MNNFVSYTKINLVVLLLWTVSLNAMSSSEEIPNVDTGMVISQDLKDLHQSILSAEKGEPEQKESSGWFSAQKWSDWWNGVDNNVMAELNQGILTKEAISGNWVLRERAQKAIDTAITNKRTENLCTLLNQMSKFAMLTKDEERCKTITNFLNQEIKVACQQKSCVKLKNILDTMIETNIAIDNNFYGDINLLLNEQKARDIKAFKDIVQNRQAFAIEVLKQMSKDRDQYKEPLLEAQSILVIQKYLAGEKKPTREQVKIELDVANDGNALDALFNALKTFSEKK